MYTILETKFFVKKKKKFFVDSNSLFCKSDT